MLRFVLGFSVGIGASLLMAATPTYSYSHGLLRSDAMYLARMLNDIRVSVDSNAKAEWAQVYWQSGPRWLQKESHKMVTLIYIVLLVCLLYVLLSLFIPDRRLVAAILLLLILLYVFGWRGGKL